MDAIRENRDSSLGRMFREQLELQSAELAHIPRTAWLEDEAHRLFLDAEDNADRALGALTVITATLIQKCRSLEHGSH